MKIAKDAILFGTLPNMKPYVVTMPVTVVLFAEDPVRAAEAAHGEIGSALMWDNEEFPVDVTVIVQQSGDDGLPSGEPILVALGNGS